jgi:putative membrane protein
MEDDMRMGLSRYLALSLVGCTLLGACKGKNTGTTADTTVPAMKAAAGDTTGGPGAAGTASGAALSDANIAALLDEANAGDSALGAAALPKLSSTSVKNFAKLMMGEHHALHIEGLNVEAAQHITPQLPTADPFKAAVVGEQTALNSMAKGRAYDSTYIANEIGIHQAVISWAGTNTPQNAALQQYMKEAGPVLQKHLKEAQSVQKKISGSRA